MAISSDQKLQNHEIEIKNIGIWALSSMIIQKYYKDRIIFGGDSCHSFPPAGGNYC